VRRKLNKQVKIVIVTKAHVLMILLLASLWSYGSRLKHMFLWFLYAFHRNEKLVKGFNCTFIALILKVENPQRLAEFIPISLVGYINKVLAKILTNRIRQVIGTVISNAQSEFIKGRQISDGILLANEVVDEVRKKKKNFLFFLKEEL